MKELAESQEWKRYVFAGDSRTRKSENTMLMGTPKSETNRGVNVCFMLSRWSESTRGAAREKAVTESLE